MVEQEGLRAFHILVLRQGLDTDPGLGLSVSIGIVLDLVPGLLLNLDLQPEWYLKIWLGLGQGLLATKDLKLDLGVIQDRLLGQDIKMRSNRSRRMFESKSGSYSLACSTTGSKKVVSKASYFTGSHCMVWSLSGSRPRFFSITGK